MMTQRRTENKDIPLLRKRMHVVIAFLLIIVGIIVTRLVFVQIVHAEEYRDTALRQHVSEQNISAHRGNVYLNGRVDAYPAAVNRRYFLAFVAPRDVPEDNLDGIARQIEAEFGASYEEIRAKLSKRNDLYEVVAHKIEKHERDRIVALDIPGVGFLPEKFRYYPGDQLAAHVLGFVGSDGESYIGRYGAEAYFEDDLSGTDGHLWQKTDARGGWLSLADRVEEGEQDGVDYVLTIDHAIQEKVEKILAEDTEKYGAEKASAIVMEPSTGKILAMANVPTFSPNAYNRVEDIAVYRNASVSDVYESGSVFKTFTIAMGLDTGKITPDSTYVDKGSVQIAEYEIGNAEGKVYGLQTMTQVLEESINTGVIHVEKLVGNILFKEYSERFGFGQRTGIELPAEAAGNLRNIQNPRRNIEFYTASFGQGITVTPLQLVRAYGALANGGYLMHPQLVEKKIYPDGTEIPIAPREVHRVISTEASHEITEMLEQVVVGGHAKLADVPGYRVGGKTGTAQVVDPTTGKYFDETRKNTTFVGYAPLDAPEFVVLVKYDNPTEVKWAATSAAPTFGRIMEFLLTHRGIQPTKSITQE